MSKQDKKKKDKCKQKDLDETRVEELVDDYDLIVHCDSFISLLPTQPQAKKADLSERTGGSPKILHKETGQTEMTGWKVSFPSLKKIPADGNEEQLTGTALAVMGKIYPNFATESDSNLKLKTIFIAVLGLYNKGKTFVLNRIGQTRLPEGISTHTEGISMKTPRRKHVNRLTLVDIAGFDAPVRINSDQEETLALRKSIDLFIQETVLRLCTAFIVVLGDITLRDQQYLEEMSQKLHEFKENFARAKSSTGEVNQITRAKFGDLIVVHNFALEADLQRCEDAFMHQVKNNYKHAVWVDDTHGKYLYAPEVAGKKAGMRHLFLGRSVNSGSLPTGNGQCAMDSHNDDMCEMVRHWMLGIANASAVSPFEEIVQCCNIIFPRFVAEVPPKLSLLEFPPDLDGTIKEFRIGFKENRFDGVRIHDGLQHTTDALAVKAEVDLHDRTMVPNHPPYDILKTKDAVYVFLDGSTEGLKVQFDPDAKKCDISGCIPPPKIYSEKDSQLVHQQRFTGNFKFAINVGNAIPGRPSFGEAAIDEDDKGNDTVIFLEIKKIQEVKKRVKVAKKEDS